MKTVLHQIFLRLMELKELTYFVGMNALSSSGIYHCEIPTNEDPSVNETVYVGLYGSEGS